jgi:hypothetical protein
LTWVGLTKATGAGFPSIVTPTPSSAMGSIPLMKSAARHDRAVDDRLLPKIDTQVPGDIAPPRSAALTTPF